MPQKKRVKKVESGRYECSEIRVGWPERKGNKVMYGSGYILINGDVAVVELKTINEKRKIIK